MTPSFAVVVVGQAPRKRLCQDVQVVWDTSLSGERNPATYCGVQICLKASEEMFAMATLGGVVKLTYGPSDFKLVGMTAGHVLEELLDGGVAEDDQAEHDAVSEDSAPRFNYPRKLGTILHPPQDDDGARSDHNNIPTPTRDWALFNLDPSAKIRPNLLHQIGASTNPFKRAAHLSSLANNRTLTTAPPASFPSAQPIEVVLLGGSSHFGGTMLGVLSHIPGGIMLDPDHGFVDAYLLTLDEGQELCDGDSGSWVVSPVSMEVFGHVVATDMTGDAYVIPLYESFAEMEGVLGVESVGLPTTADLLDAALRASAGVGGWPPRQAMLVEDCAESRERRASEVFLMCDGWKLREKKRSSLYHDGDSGYGSTRSAWGGSPCESELLSAP
jgi:hypothetical protein